MLMLLFIYLCNFLLYLCGLKDYIFILDECYEYEKVIVKDENFYVLNHCTDGKILCVNYKCEGKTIYLYTKKYLLVNSHNIVLQQVKIEPKLVVVKKDEYYRNCDK